MLMTRARLRAGDDGAGARRRQRRRPGRDPDRAAARRARLRDRRHRRKLDAARALGAEDVFDHYARRLRGGGARLTDGRGVDIVVEHVGEATWERSVARLARGGRLVTCGATTGHDAPIDLRHPLRAAASLLGSYMGAKAELLRAAPFFFSGKLTPVVDEVLPLAEAAAAQRTPRSAEAVRQDRPRRS